MSILVVGSIAFDSVETPSGKRTEMLGGAASYLSLAACHWATPRMVGVVGNDFPNEHLAMFHRHGIDTAGIVINPNGRTFRWDGKYDGDLSNAETLETQLGVFKTFDGTIPEDWRKTPYVVLGNIQPSIQRKVLEQLDPPKWVALDTMNYWINSAREELIHTLELVDMLCINETEARLLSKETDLARAAEVIFGMGPQVLVIKQAADGACMYLHDGIIQVPAYRVPLVRDPTGAGDSFAGAMMGYLASCDNLAEPAWRGALLRGSVVASFTVEQFGVEGLRMANTHSIEKRLAQLEGGLEHLSAKPPAHAMSHRAI